MSNHRYSRGSQINLPFFLLCRHKSRVFKLRSTFNKCPPPLPSNHSRFFSRVKGEPLIEPREPRPGPDYRTVVDRSRSVPNRPNHFPSRDLENKMLSVRGVEKRRAVFFVSTIGRNKV